MHTPLLPPRGFASALASYIGPEGSIVVNLDSKTIQVHDGVTAGGVSLSKVGHQHAANEVVSWLGFTPLDTALIGQANGVAPLDENGQIPASFISGGGGTGDAGGLAGDTLASNVLYSSLTSVGVLQDLQVINAIAGSVTGNAGSADKLSAARAIALSGDVTGSADFDGSDDVSIVVSLANVNANPVSDALARVTLNNKGQVVSTNPANADDIAGALGFIPVDQEYVDNMASNFTQRDGVRLLVSTNVAGTYNNGTDGTDATLTGTGSIPTMGGATPALNDRLVLGGQTNGIQNGVFKVLQINPWILKRDGGLDDVKNGAMVLVSDGDHKGEKWTQIAPNPITIGTTALKYTLFLAAQSAYTQGTGIAINGSNVISNTGVVSLAGTANQIVPSAANGAVTLSLAPSVTITGTMTANAFSGSGAALTALNATNLGTGIVPVARLGSGTANASSVLYGDNVWRVPTAPIPTSLGATATINYGVSVNGVYVGANGSSPYVSYVNANAPADQKVWNTFVDNSGTWVLKAQQDGSASGGLAMMFTRSGAGAAVMTVNATTVNLNANVTATKFTGDGSGITGVASAKAVAAPMLTGTAVADIVTAGMADNDYFRIRVGGTATDGGWAEIATADGGNEPIYVRQYSGNFAFTTIANSATLLDATGNTSFPKTVTAAAFSGAGTLLTALNAANLGSGIVAPARMGTGTANSSSVLYGDNVWRVPSITLLQLGNGQIKSNGWAGSQSGNDGYVFTGSGNGRFGFYANSGVVDVYVDGNVFVNEGAEKLLSQAGFEALTSVNGSKLTALNATNLATGTVAPARLGSGTASANTVLYGDNTWKVVTVSALAGTGTNPRDITTKGVYIGVDSGGSPTAVWIHPSAGADAKASHIYTSSNGQLNWALLNDTFSSGPNFMTVTRSGTTASLVTFTSTGFNLAIGTGALQLNGSAGTAGQALVSNGNAAAPTWQTLTSTVLTGTGVTGKTAGTTSVNAGVVSGTTPIIYLNTSTGGSDQKVWSIQNDTGGNFILKAEGDSTSGNEILKIARTGTTATLATLNATAMTLNGVMTAQSFVPSSATVPTNGMYLPAANTLAFATASGEALRFNASNAIGLAGANYGTAGQVLTSGGASAAPTWTTLSVSSVNATAALPFSVAANAVQAGTYGSGGIMSLVSSGAGADAKSTFLINDTSGAFYIRLVNDTNTGSTDAMKITRSGTAAQVVTFNAVNVNLNITGALQVAGAAGTAGQVLTSNGASAAPSWQDATGGGGGTANNLVATSAVTLATTSGAYAGLVGGLGTLALSHTTGAGANGRLTTLQVNSAGSIVWSLANDTNSSSTPFFNVTRTTNNTASSVILTGTNVTLNGLVSSNSSMTATSFIPSSATVPSNGLYLPAANTVGLATNGAVALMVNASNAVGFGGANYGTAGQILQSNGNAAAPTWVNNTGATSLSATGTLSFTRTTSGVYAGLVGSPANFIMINGNAGADAKVWATFVDNSGTWVLHPQQDASGSGTQFLTVPRSGSVAATVTMNSIGFTYNGQQVTGANTGGSVSWTAANGGSGSGNGGAVNLKSGSADSSTGTGGLGGNMNLTMGNGYGTSAGGSFVLVTGSASGTGGGGGGISMTVGSPAAASANGGNITMTAGRSGDNGGTGGAVSINAGTGGNTSGAGGNATLAAGAGNIAGNGGTLNLNAGNGGSTSGAGGTINLNAGSGSSGTTTGNGGDINITAGGAGASRTGGNIRIAALAVDANASSGFISIATAAGGSTAGNSGAVTLLSGNTSSGTTGAVTVGSGNTGGNFSSGTVTIKTGDATGSTNAGDLNLQAGSCSSGTTGTGHVYIRTNGGIHSSFFKSGKFYVGNGSTQGNYAIGLFGPATEAGGIQYLFSTQDNTPSSDGTSRNSRAFNILTETATNTMVFQSYSTNTNSLNGQSAYNPWQFRINTLTNSQGSWGTSDVMRLEPQHASRNILGNGNGQSAAILINKTTHSMNGVLQANGGAELIGTTFISQAALANNLTSLGLGPLEVRGNSVIAYGATATSRILSSGANVSALYLQNSNSGSATTDGSAIQVETNGTTLSLWNYENGMIRFAVNNTEYVRITNAGFVNPVAQGTQDMGISATASWRTVYATGGVQTSSDLAFKQDIEDLEEAEIRVAIKLKKLIKRYRMKKDVELQGDAAKFRIGLIAQDVHEAFASEGLDANDYEMYKEHQSWLLDGEYVEEGTEGAEPVITRTVNYSELSIFMLAAL